MFAGGAGLVFGNQNTVTEPLTHDPGANAFLAQIDLTLEADQQLRTLDETMRLKVLSVLHSKMSQTTIQNPSTYLLGIMRNEKKATGPYQSYGKSSVDRRETYTSTVSAQMLRTMASPQQAIGVASRPPPWVADAWPLVQRPSQFLRKMMSVLGADSMGLISHHPMSVQVSLLTSLLVTSAAWPDPQLSLKNMLAIVKDLPPLPLAVSMRPQQRTGKPLVVLQLGGSMGAEWLNLRFALENLKNEFPDIRLEARHVFPGDETALAFHDAIATAVVMDGSAEVHKDAASMASVVGQQLPAWKNADTTVLVLVTLPVPNNKYGGAVEGPQWHTKPANVLWDMFLVLRALTGLPDNRYAALFLEPVPANKAPSQLLDQYFGEPWIIPRSKTKIPTSCLWRCRSWPVLSELDLSERKVERIDTDNYRIHASLLPSCGEGPEVSLPSPDEVESFYDALADPAGTQRDLSTVDAFKVIHSVTSASAAGSAPGHLLDRADLARLWGVDGWQLDTTFSQVAPCHTLCAMNTGFAVTLGGLEETTRCGVGRWCYPCDRWYALLHATPPPHTYTLLHKLLQKTFSQSVAGMHSHFAKLPMHTCDGNGCGCF